MEYLSLGKIIDSFGLDGTLKIFSTTSKGESRYKTNAKVYLYNPENKEEKPAVVLSYRHNGFFDFVKLDIIKNKDEAVSKKGYEIHVIKSNDDLNENEYFFSDLEGCTICEKPNKNLGIVKKVEEYPAQITLRVSRKGKPDFFVPFIKDFINEVDIKNKTIFINVIEGLL